MNFITPNQKHILNILGNPNSNKRMKQGIVKSCDTKTINKRFFTIYYPCSYIWNSINQRKFYIQKIRMKKFMIHEILTHEQKINSILKNKNINKENKLKLINNILINKNKKNVHIIQKINSDQENEINDEINYEPFQVNESNNEQFFEVQEQEPEQNFARTQETEPRLKLQLEQQLDDQPSLPPAFFTRNHFTLDKTPWRKTPRQQRSKSIYQNLISQGPKKRKLNREDLVEEEPRKKLSRLDTINKEKKKSAQVLLKKAIETLTTLKPITRVKEKLKKKVKEIIDKENINLKKNSSQQNANYKIKTRRRYFYERCRTRKKRLVKILKNSIRILRILALFQVKLLL
jgi:hypothetical protein